MSYGVVASKSAHIAVETTEAIGARDSDLALDRFQGIWGSAWVAGRFTVTRLHVNIIPNRAGRGMAMLDLDLRDLDAVELAGGRLQRELGLRTSGHVVWVRVARAAALAEQVAGLAEAAKAMPARRRY